MKRAQKPLQLTHPGGPCGWPDQGAGVSWEDAVRALSRRTDRPVYIAGIDQATVSGWAVHDARKLIAHGTATGTFSVVDVLESWRALPDFDFTRVLVVFEDHRQTRPRDQDRYTNERGAPRRHKDDTEPLKLGRAHGCWETLLDLRAQPRAQRLIVAPHEWRRVIKGARFGQADDWKSAALRWATGIGLAVSDDNEADACGIATWGAVDGLYAWARARLEDNAAARAARSES